MLAMIDRRRRDDRFLEWKVRIFTVAAALVVAGMFLEVPWMTGAAIVLLVGAMLLRFLPGGRLPDTADDEDEEEDAQGEPARPAAEPGERNAGQGGSEAR